MRSERIKFCFYARFRSHLFLFYAAALVFSQLVRVHQRRMLHAAPIMKFYNRVFLPILGSRLNIQQLAHVTIYFINVYSTQNIRDERILQVSMYKMSNQFQMLNIET